MKSTNARIADLLDAQTYNERMEMAKYLSDTVVSWIEDGATMNDDSFAVLLGSFADSASEEDNPTTGETDVALTN